MLDGVSLDQLRSFLAAVDEGSFSAAARKLRRAQSAVSELVSTLEDQIGVSLFDRSGRYPKLTPQGAVLPNPDADAYVDRAVDRDSDLWVIEVETRDGENPFEREIVGL